MSAENDPEYWCSCPPWVRKCEPDCPSLIPAWKRAKGATKICPKCKCTSGDNWEQCNGACPIPSSPHYDEMVEHAFQLIPLPRE